MNSGTTQYSSIKKNLFFALCTICISFTVDAAAKKTLKVHNVCDNDCASSTKSIYITSDYFAKRVAVEKVRFVDDPKKAEKTFYFTTFSNPEADVALDHTSSASEADVIFNVVDNWATAKYRVYMIPDRDTSTTATTTLCITYDKDAANVKIGEKISTSTENQRKTAVMYMLGFFK